MRLTFLGTGTSKGIPEIGCTCPTCMSTDPRDKRLRVSALVETAEARILIDCGPDFRTQMLGIPFDRLDGVCTDPKKLDGLLNMFIDIEFGIAPDSFRLILV